MILDYSGGPNGITAGCVRRDAMIDAEAGVYGNLLQHQETNTASKEVIPTNRHVPGCLWHIVLSRKKN